MNTHGDNTSAEADAEPISITPELQYQIGQHIIDLYENDAGRLSTFEHLGREWELLPTVWPPYYAPGAEHLIDEFPFEEMDSFLEIGSGAGVISVLACLAGVSTVVSVDINEAALENTRRNAERHAVSSHVSVRYSDLYSGIAPREKFDGIFWNPPFLDAPENARDGSIWFETMFDPGFAKIRTFMSQGRQHLTTSGRLLLWFGESLGEPDLIRRMAAENGMSTESLGTLNMTDVPAVMSSLIDQSPAEGADPEVQDATGGWFLHLLSLRQRD